MKIQINNLIIKLILVIGDWDISCEIAIRWMWRAYQWQVNIGLGDVLVPSGNKPLSAPMLT